MPMRHALSADRAEAGRRLADRLLCFKDARPLMLALPRGGVPVGLEVARTLDALLDLVLVRKIGAPFQPELTARDQAGPGIRPRARARRAGR